MGSEVWVEMSGPHFTCKMPCTTCTSDTFVGVGFPCSSQGRLNQYQEKWGCFVCKTARSNTDQFIKTSLADKTKQTDYISAFLMQLEAPTPSTETFTRLVCRWLVCEGQKRSRSFNISDGCKKERFQQTLKSFRKDEADLFKQAIQWLLEHPASKTSHKPKSQSDSSSSQTQQSSGSSAEYETLTEEFTGEQERIQNDECFGGKQDSAAKRLHSGMHPPGESQERPSKRQNTNPSPTTNRQIYQEQDDQTEGFLPQSPFCQHVELSSSLPYFLPPPQPDILQNIYTVTGTPVQILLQLCQLLSASQDLPPPSSRSATTTTNFKHTAVAVMRCFEWISAMTDSMKNSNDRAKFEKLKMATPTTFIPKECPEETRKVFASNDIRGSFNRIKRLPTEGVQKELAYIAKKLILFVQEAKKEVTEGDMSALIACVDTWRIQNSTQE